MLHLTKSWRNWSKKFLERCRDSVLLSRSQGFDFIRLEGLQKLTNVTAHDWDLYILKELVDNALDADESMPGTDAHPSIRVVMEYDRQAYGLRVTVSNKARFPLEHITELFSLDKRVSVKDYYKIPTRGAQGNALKTILGIPYALHYFYLADYNLEETPLSITYGAERYQVKLAVDELRQTVAVIPPEPLEEDDPVDETTISVGIFRFRQKQPRQPDELIEWAQAYALFNPHASFSFEFIFLEEDGAVREESYAAAGNPDWNSKFDLRQQAPIDWYTFSEFRELLHAMLLRSEEKGHNAPTIRDVAANFGINTGADQPLSEFLGDHGLNPRLIKHLFDQLRQQASNNEFPILGKIGAEHLQAQSDLPPVEEDEQPLFFYRHAQGDLDKHSVDDETLNPYVLEVAMSANTEEKRQVMVGINHTRTYQDPFFNKPLVPHGADIQQVQRSLEKLLDFYGLRDETPITLVVHLIAPNVRFESYGKDAISDEPYRETLTRLIHEVVEEYREATRPPEPVDYLTDPAREQLEEAIHIVRGTRNTNFSENQLLFAIKNLLVALNLPEVLEDLRSTNADARLRGVIQAHHREQRIKGLYIRPSGRLAVPRHPHDSINVFFDNVNLLDLLRQYQARAVMIVNRREPDLEELLIALGFPVAYDCAILRADGNLRGAIELLIRQMVTIASDVDEQDVYGLPKLWYIGDATLDSVQLMLEIRQMLQERELPEDILLNLSLQADDVYAFQLWRDQLPEPPEADVEALKRNGIPAAHLAFLCEDGFTSRVDSMRPEVLAHWFESKLQAADEPLKAIPDARSLIGEVTPDIQQRFRRVLSDIAFDVHDLESVLAMLVEEWREAHPNWATDLHAHLSETLLANPRESWQKLLDDELDHLMRSYLTPKQLASIRETLSKS